ncbi:MAG: hypothetical protein COT92_00315 [Candidatus Doudnabacteria bacterium CG10_big_fil_rev_8_21_14_0_10_42_18]|uniref:Uncharacterized protein n=1 Tax=Candidatus Doudnabacteria bacterium CG10_big_fil_rev_8_21_14_0_10_42_18 TaxID=1974552 RepID=A0A2H0VBU6_9BACT|nr:MAG: hypothetical protein COT92_00315 [Candidatus Doudnabacteria bacterium CG10_big_fil_rev_8_21_14_0_10_42_18]
MDNHNQEQSNGANQTKRFFIFFVLVALVIAAILVLKSSGAGSSFVWQISKGGELLFPLVSIAALIDSINPCAFSILLLTIAFLFSLGTLSRGKILSIGLAYIFGIFIAYIGIGLGLLSALHLFNTPHFMSKVGAVLLFLFGLISLINHFFPSFPIKLKIPNAAHSKIADLMNKASIPTVFLLGALVGLCEFPCTGGPYLLVLGLLHDSQTKLKGLGYLVWYNILFVLPLVAVLFLASQQVVLDKFQAWKKHNIGSLRLISGIAMIILSFIILMF